MSQVLDYSFGRPDPHAIKSAGYVGVMRYLSHDPAKNMTTAEAVALNSQGLRWGLVWESTGQTVKGGAVAGTSDATAAHAQAQSLNYQGPIYFAIDYDAPESDQPAINAYFEAVAQFIGLARTGVYSGYWPLKRLFDAGLVVVGWQTVAWSGSNKDPRISLYQNGAQALGADVNDVLKDNWGGLGIGDIPMVDKNMAIDLGVGILGRSITDAQAPDYLASVVGQPCDVVIRNLVNSDEAKAFRARAAANVTPTELGPGVYKVG